MTHIQIYSVAFVHSLRLCGWQPSRFNLFMNPFWFIENLFTNFILKDGRTCAHIAAMYAKEEMMRFLINKKVDLKKTAGVRFKIWHTGRKTEYNFGSDLAKRAISLAHGLQQAQ